jgi:hypothetical protein
MRRRLTVRSDTGMSFMWWLEWHGCVASVLMVSQVLRIANECRALTVGGVSGAFVFFC